MKAKNKIIKIIIGLTLAVVCCFCYYFANNEQEIITSELTDIKIDLSSDNYYQNGIYKMTITKTPANSNETIYYKTDNPDVAFISGDSIITRSAGEATITAYTNDNRIEKTYLLKVLPEPNINFKEKGPLEIDIKDKVKLHINPERYSLKNIKFESNHPEIISVDLNGNLISKRPGFAIITAQTPQGKKTDIKVIAKVKDGFLTNKSLDDYNLKHTKNLMIVAHPDDESLWGGAHLKTGDYFVVCLTNGHNKIRSKDFYKVLDFTNNKGIILNYPDSQDGIREDWDYVTDGLLKDLETLLKYKNWDKIVTYGPDGVTGHVQHLLNYTLVKKAALNTNTYDNLYYFGKYYKKNQVPKDLVKMSEDDLNFKIDVLNNYTSVKGNINNYWYHMLPYENWVKASEWDVNYKNEVVAKILDDDGKVIGAISDPNSFIITLDTKDINVIGLKPEYKVSIMEKTVSFTIARGNDTVEKMKLEYNPSINLTGYDEGVFNVKLTANKKYVIPINPVLSVKIEKK